LSACAAEFDRCLIPIPAFTKGGLEMLTRRRFLALAPAGLATAQIPVPFQRIDTHAHVNRPSQVILNGLKNSGFHILSICVSRATGDAPSDLDEQLRGTRELSRQSGGLVFWAGSFDARRWSDKDFAGRTIAQVNDEFRQGAIALKIWKNIGMSLRSRTGRYMMPDDPAFHPVYEATLKADRTLVAHLAEPNGAWMPIDEKNPEKGFYGSHPEWSMYGKADAPAKEDILKARDRVIARYPKLRVVGCHLGSNEEDLGALATRLDRFPNFAVDLAARVRYLVAGDQKRVREFLTRYQDRIVYGTDFTPGAKADEQRASDSFTAQHERDWQYFSSTGPLTYNRREATGLGMPSTILQKIFRENAVRWFPGIA
jgi:predicted TIM-barrel fold metal-dependent hydrolase